MTENTQRLTFAEEIMLLLLDDEEGEMASVDAWMLKCILAGAVLMDLALRDRIDTDLEHLFIIDETPTGDTSLDTTLSILAGSKNDDRRSAKSWIEQIASGSENFALVALKRLVTRGILVEQENRFLWRLQSRTYPMIDGEAEREVRARIQAILFSDEVPDPHDIVIINLADSCGLFGAILGDHDSEQIRERIEHIRHMDLIGQAMTNAIREIQGAVALSGYGAPVV